MILDLVLLLAAYAFWYFFGLWRGRELERRRWAMFGQTRPSEVSINYTTGGLAMVECRLHADKDRVAWAVTDRDEVERSIFEHIAQAHPDRIVLGP